MLGCWPPQRGSPLTDTMEAASPLLRDRGSGSGSGGRLASYLVEVSLPTVTINLPPLLSTPTHSVYPPVAHRSPLTDRSSSSVRFSRPSFSIW